MIKIEFEIFCNPRPILLEIDVGWILDTLGSNWIRFGSLSLQDEKILERVRFVGRAMPSV